MTVHDFSFSEHALDFDDHIVSSIPGHADQLIPTCVALSRRFVQPGTTVVDVGCSTGRLLASVREANQAARPDVSYLGIDVVSDFKPHWDKLAAANIRYEACDARIFDRFKNLSLALSIFTIQFVRPVDKLPLLRRVYDGLVEGGALIIAEKTLAETSRGQDAMTFPYYDYKRANGHSAEDILDKERSLRGQMTLWTEVELKGALRCIGFPVIEPIWRSYMFVGMVALK